MKDIEKDPNRIIKLPEVVMLTSKSRSSIYKAIESEGFPKSIPLAKSGRSVGWKYGDVLNWIDKQATEVQHG